MLKTCEDVYIQYEEARDILFVFGAGASIAEGAPLQRDILKLIFESSDTELWNSDAAEEVRSFIQYNFYISDGEYPTLESIFGYLDYFISQGESLGGEYTTSRISDIKEALIKIIHHAISNVKGSRGGTYRKFWEGVDRINRNISVMSMNYDTLIDEAFDFLYPNRGYIDYCIELINYHHYDQIDPFDWWINPRQPVPVWEGGDPKPIKLIKVHGSLNWKYCNCCNQVLLTAWNTKIDLSSMAFKGYIHPSSENPEGREFDLSCPLDGNRFDSFIIPPSHIKELSHPAVNKLLDESAIEIRKSKRVVFVGYSFPEADVHIRALFKKNISSSAEIHVVDPFINSSIRSNYKSLSQTSFFYEKTFDQFVADNLEELLAMPNK